MWMLGAREEEESSQGMGFCRVARKIITEEDILNCVSCDLTCCLPPLGLMISAYHKSTERKCTTSSQ